MIWEKSQNLILAKLAHDFSQNLQTSQPGQAYPQDAINEFIIQKLNPLVVVNFSSNFCIVACIMSHEFTPSRQLWDFYQLSFPELM